MNEQHEMNGFGGYGFLIVLILFIWLIFGGGFGGLGGGRVGMNEAEKQGIIDSARTQYLVEQTAHATQAEVAGVGNMLGNKIDFYAYQDLRDQLQAERAKNMMLENKVYSDAKFGALEAQLQVMACSMLKQPPVYGVGTSCNAIYAPSPCPSTTTTSTGA